MTLITIKVTEMKTNSTYVTPKLRKINPGTTDHALLECLEIDSTMDVDAIAEYTGIKRGSVGGRLAVLIDNGYVDRERVDGHFQYTKLAHKRQYNPTRRFSEARKAALLNNNEPEPDVKVLDVTPAKGANKFDEVIEALTKASCIDEVKQKIRVKLIAIEEHTRTELSEIDDLLASL